MIMCQWYTQYEKRKGGIYMSKVKVFLRLLALLVILGVIGYYYIATSNMGPSKPKTITINTEAIQENVQKGKNFEIIKKEVLENQKDVTQCGAFLDDENIIIYKKIKLLDPLSKTEEECYKNADRIYILNVNTLKEERVSEDENPKKFSSVFYTDKNKIYFRSSKYIDYDTSKGFEDEYYAYDRETKERTKLSKDNFFVKLICSNISDDGKYSIRELEMNEKSGDFKFSLFNIEKQQEQSIMFKDNTLKIFANDYYSDDNSIYFSGYEKKKAEYKTTLYKMDKNNSNNRTEIFSWPSIKANSENEFYFTYTQIRQVTFLDDKRIIFEGGYNNETGIFIYNLETKKLYKVASNIMLPCDEIIYRRFWISPDKSKIAYTKYEDVGGKKQWNTYIATISGNNLVQNTLILENCNFSNAQWSKDGKKLMIVENWDVEHGWPLGVDKIKEHLITLK